MPIPINIETVNRRYGLKLDESTIENYYQQVREPRAQIKSSGDVVLNDVESRRLGFRLLGRAEIDGNSSRSRYFGTHQR